jgi:Spy/CpxP family protein refolding chaperone
MTSTRFLLPVFGIVLGLAFHAAPALAHEHDDDGDEMAEKLDFTPAQQAQMDELDFRAKAARIAIKAREETAELELRHAMRAATIDEKAVAKALDALNIAESELRKSKVDEMLAVRKLLTPDQATKLVAMWHDEGEDEDDDEDEESEHHRGGDKDHDDDDDKDEHHGEHHRGD